MLTHVEWPSRFGKNAGRSGHDRVEILAARRAVREIGHVPAAADDPRVVRMGRGVGPDRLEDTGPAVRLAEVALEAVDPAEDRVDVDVLEAGQEEPAGEIDDPRSRSDEVGDVGRLADRADPVAVNGDGRGPWPGRIDGMDVAAPEDEVGGAFGMRHRRRMTRRGDRDTRDPDHGTGRCGTTGRWSAYPRAMTTVELIHPGYIRDDSRVGSSISLIRDGDAIFVADPGSGRLARRDPRAAPRRGIEPGDVTHVTFSHHHPDHTMNAALFPNAEVIDFWARYRNDLWLDHPGDGWDITEHVQLWLTPGHTEEDSLADRPRRRRGLRPDPPLVAPGSDARARPVRPRPGDPRDPTGARPRRRRHRHPGPRRGVPRRALGSSVAAESTLGSGPRPDQATAEFTAKGTIAAQGGCPIATSDQTAVRSPIGRGARPPGGRLVRPRTAPASRPRRRLARRRPPRSCRAQARVARMFSRT